MSNRYVTQVDAEPRVPLIERTVPSEWVAAYLVTLALVALLLVAAGARMDDPVASVRPEVSPAAVATPLQPPPRPPIPPTPQVVGLPGGVHTIFEGNQMLVAYYGTAGTGSLGVLGEQSPARIMPRLKRAAQAFAVGGRRVQPVFELIVTVAHAGPGKSGQYSSDIARSGVQRYIEAAHRFGVLLVLDLQPGKADFLSVAKRWAWALRDPWVGLALDPEWRMSLGGIPGKRIGSVGAAEINRVSSWLEGLIRSNSLPQKVFMLHQFRADMIRFIENVRPRADLVMVQHIDGYGPPRAKLATFRALARPEQFRLGFKLFYHQDVPRMSAAAVLRIRPRVALISFQ